MNTPGGRGWDKVEYWSSYFLLAVLGSVILTRLAFAGIWSVPTLDLVLGGIALLLVLASPWIARRRRALRIGIVAYATATQLVPVCVRHPAVLLPLLGALIPVAIMVWALAALSRKGRAGQGTGHT
ncbi:LrgA [Rhodanobacter sp. DHB23]|uniref:LrgA n=1 Tax=Rhodanobacter sp. DHB23 TaxID=2775923 RepID=UPI001780DDA2|nr:LrgA [Rhodanobacter sp. DHB23]MBD8873818.1 LrgA [Rhodanobacter sp. DHB23]